MERKICPKCGREVETRFCPDCGYEMARVKEKKQAPEKKPRPVKGGKRRIDPLTVKLLIGAVLFVLCIGLLIWGAEAVFTSFREGLRWTFYN